MTPIRGIMETVAYDVMVLTPKKVVYQKLFITVVKIGEIKTIERKAKQRFRGADQFVSIDHEKKLITLDYLELET